MNAFTYLFVVFLVAGLAVQLWLAARQASHILAHSRHVPEAFADRISLEDHQKAARYSLARLGAQRWDLALSAALLLGWTLGGGLNLLDGWLAEWPIGAPWNGVALVIATLLISATLELPLAAWRTFGIEARFGFNRTTVAGFVRDKLLGAALALVLGIPLLGAILWLMQGAGDYWWLWAWLVWMGFTLFLSWAYPVLIAPLFNRFEPLADASLRKRLEALLARCGFRSKGMFVMDGSRRSSHGNAYFTGFGANKRIVFFDTLLDGLDADEVEAVLAHELGHFKRHHVAKGIALSGAMALLGLAVLGWLALQPWFYHGLGVEQGSPALALVLFMLTLPTFTFFLTPLLTRLARSHEYEADAFAAEQTDPRHLISGLVKMYRDNASTLTPDPLYSAFYHSHPPAPLRVAQLASRIPA